MHEIHEHPSPPPPPHPPNLWPRLSHPTPSHPFSPTSRLRSGLLPDLLVHLLALLPPGLQLLSETRLVLRRPHLGESRRRGRWHSLGEKASPGLRFGTARADLVQTGKVPLPSVQRGRVPRRFIRRANISAWAGKQQSKPNNPTPGPSAQMCWVGPGSVQVRIWPFTQLARFHP